jgi:anti-anti-sigma factor
MATPLSISTERGENGAIVLTAIGEIDLSNIDAFAKALDDASAVERQDGSVFTVVLSGVEYVDSGAINVLFGHTGDIELIANPVLMPVLKISGLTDMVNVRSSQR